MNIRILPLAFVLFSVLSAQHALGQTSIVTFVNCTPDPLLAVVDVYVQQGQILNKVEDVAYQRATNFNEFAIYSDLETIFYVAPGNSASNSESIINYSFTPASDAGYVLILSGVSSETGYAPNPDSKPITLSMQHMEVPLFSGQPNQIGILTAHAVTDLETGDAYVRGIAKELANNISYTGITSALSNANRVPAIIDFTKQDNKSVLYASFEANLTSYQSETVIFILTGFKSPQDNNQSENGLTLLAVLGDGSVIVNPIIAGSQKSRIQWVNDCADPSLGAMDVWINGVKSADNLLFRKATPFVEIDAGAELTVGFSPATAASYKDTIKTVKIAAPRPGKTYHYVISGVIDTSKFAYNINGKDILLNVIVADGALTKSNQSGKTAVRIVHSSPDQASITVKNATTTYAAQVTYGSYSLEYAYTEPGFDTLWVYLDSTSTTTKGWLADFRGYDRAALVLASGFVDPSANQNGPAFKLIMVDSAGNVNTNLPELLRDTISSVDEDIVPATLWRIAPNPATDRFTIVVPFTSNLVARHGTILTAVVYSSTGIFLGSYPMNFSGLSATVTIPTTTLANGSYFVQVRTAAGVTVGSAAIMVTK